MSERDRRIDYVEIPAREVGRSKQFYSTVFGWTYEDWGADYADTRSSGVGSGLNGSSDHRPKTALVTLYADHLENVRDAVVAAGGMITREIFSFPGGRRFHFTDPAGNELAVWSEAQP
jgi:predicted enzyme related to lactoylglutathione lyase